MTALVVAAAAVLASDGAAAMLASAGVLAVCRLAGRRRARRGPRQPLTVSLAPAHPLPAAAARKAVPAALRETRAQSALLRPYSRLIPDCAAPAGTALPVPPFATADEAVAWMRAEYAVTDAVMAGMLSPQGLYRRLAKDPGPGAQGRLRAARRALARKGIL